MTFNSLICKIFEHDKNGDISLENIVSDIVCVGVVASFIILFIYGWYLHLVNYHPTLDPNLLISILKTLTMAFSIAITLTLIAGILLFGIDAIKNKWITIKDKTVAHCHVKKEEDETHD